ncbi:hypothetical protein [Dactylosporangium sp. CA-092794]|uniref:hypothetical protein n=1 Tax=Dactylosporangium sp. CA-092794 TaxID=3239929 RepID=UPI003D8D33A7
MNAQTAQTIGSPAPMPSKPDRHHPTATTRPAPPPRHPRRQPASRRPTARQPARYLHNITTAPTRPDHVSSAGRPNMSTGGTQDVGTSYENLMVVGDLADVVSALGALGADAWVVPAAAGRVAVLPREHEYNTADVDRLARSVSATLRTSVLSNIVFDSDVVFINVYRNGDRIHEYVSERAALVDWFIDDNGEAKFRLGDVEYSADAEYPKGPGGADPDVFAPFGVGSVDLDRLGVTLRGEFGADERIFAEFLHRLIMKAMNLDPAGLTTSFRWARQDDLPGAVRVKPADRAPGVADGWTLVKVVLVTGLPLDADLVAAGQILADTVARGSLPLRAIVGCAGVLHGAAGGADIFMAQTRMRPRGATYYIELQGSGDDRRQILDAARQVWTQALRDRYRLAAGQQPQLINVTDEQFDLGFGRATDYCSTT